MKMNLQPAVAPSFLKVGFFGDTGSGKSWTAAQFLSQFIKEYCPESQLAMFDTEPSAGYVAPMVKAITGKELLSVSSRSFADLMDFTKECIDKKYVALVDSVTHPWRTLCSDFLEAKKSRVRAANGRVETVILSLKDWGPIKEIWNQFSELFVFSPIHFCIAGREGDVWEQVTDEEGNTKSEKTGVKMKTETEFGYEPSLLIRMQITHIEKAQGKEPEKIRTGHFAYVPKDRFNVLTGYTSPNNPDIEFFRPHLDCLNIGGKGIMKSEGKKIFEAGSGPNWETIKAQRAGMLENIKDDLTLVYPGRTNEENKAKVQALRHAFGTSSWTELETDERKFPLDVLVDGRDKLTEFLKGAKSS
jgi:hypothetical protein